jgi:hypothetical protein
MPQPSNQTREVFIDLLKNKVDAAVAAKDPVEMAAMQLELQFAMLRYLQQIDWKLWQFYQKFGT